MPKLLIIDDEPAFTELLAEPLNAAGYETLVAYNGLQALELVEHSSVDLALIDVLMPGIDGFETCSRLKALPHLQDLPVIFLTSKVNVEDKIKGFEVGAVDYLNRFTELEELEARISIHLNLRRTQQELKAQNEQLLKEIAERKQAEQALREYQARMDSTFRVLPDLMFEVDYEGRIFNFRAPAPDTLYTSPDRFIGKRVTEIMPPEAADVIMPALQQAITHGRHVGAIYQLSVQGEVRWFELSIQSYQQQSAQRLIVLARDISERKKTQEALQQAKEAAELANQAKSAFLANMSHEIRTPLNAIMGFSHLLLRDKQISPDSLKKLQIIVRSGEHLLNLINDTLEMSKIEANDVQFHFTDFDLHKLLHELQDMVQLRAQAKQLQLSFEMSPKVPQYIYSDSKKIKQLLLNVLSNAIKYTYTGSVSLYADFQPAGPEHSQSLLLVQIEDSGIGISAEDLERIFEPFVQLPNHQKGSEGVGLGLAISKNLLNQLGGKLSVQSKLQQGSRFHFEIPVQAAEPPQISQAPQRRVVGQQVHQNYKLLIVDDDPVNRQLIKDYLEPLALELRFADNGQQALSQTENWHPDLIFMDMRMPVMDGYTATRHIKELSASWPVQPIIVAITASSFEEERKEILATGCDEFLRKPVEESQILNLIRKYLHLEYLYED